MARYIRELKPEDVIGGERGCWYVLLPIKDQQIGAGNFFYKRHAERAARRLLRRHGDDLIDWPEEARI